MKERVNHIIGILNKEIWLYLSISFGIVFFVYIFNPFPLDHFDDNNRKIFKVGMGAIIFLSMFFVRAIYPGFTKKAIQKEKLTALSSLYNSSIIWILSFISFSFYLHYAGLLSISPYLLFKAALICFVPPLILWPYDKMSELKLENESLITENRIFQTQIDKHDEDFLNRSITFFSNNNGDNLKFLIADIIFINSSDNYVEIHYLEGDNSTKKLIRNTLHNIELQLKPFANFIRCHRTHIVNTQHIEKLNGNCNHNELIIKGYDLSIPISRQYFITVKEAL